MLAPSFQDRSLPICIVNSFDSGCDWPATLSISGLEEVAPRALRVLLLLPKHLPVGLAIGIKAIMFTPSQAAFSSGLVTSQSGRHFFNTARKSCRSSSIVGRPKNQ